MVIILGYIFLYKQKTKNAEKKISIAKSLNLHEPISLHPVIDYDVCIGSGACVAACPEYDIIGLVHNKGTLINGSRCVGHGACFHSCPVEAISLVMGTESRGIELPHVDKNYETNVKGMFIAGELGGMGLIKNAVEQAKMAVENMASQIDNKINAEYDAFIVGGGPAGIAASLKAKQLNLKFKTTDQDSVGGSVLSFPRSKVVMTSPMDIPLYGKVKLKETNKTELLSLWHSILENNNISINENEKVISVKKSNGIFQVITTQDKYTAKKVLLAIGRRGSPRKLGVEGEKSEKVAYRLIEPEHITNKHVLIVGGGDSAIESAMLLLNGTNTVTISYRSGSFNRIKQANFEKINAELKKGTINIIYNSTVKEIGDDKVMLSIENESDVTIPNDLVYIFIGGELPNRFLEENGIAITKRFGDVVLKH